MESIGYELWKPIEGPRWIIWMDGHLDVVLLGIRDDGIEEVFHV